MNEIYDIGRTGLSVKELLSKVESGTVVTENTDTALDANSIKPISNGTVTEALSKKIDEAEADKRYMKQSQIPETSDGYWYGVEWNTAVASTAMTRIGNMELHRTLPVQNGMRGCLLDDDGNVVAYLPSSSWEGATLDGSKGQVMVEIPEHYRKFEEVGTIRRCKISTYPYAGYHRVPKMYISAYEATVQRSTSKLCSVKNSSADYRGGTNTSAWDGTYRTLLGRPLSVVSRTNLRLYARKRNIATTEWNCLDYNAYKAVFWLYYVEYANRNCQLAFNAEKDVNGYAQGGLGNGATTLTNEEWVAYNNESPFIPCGYTDELGNGSGEVAYDLHNSDGSIVKTVMVSRYRGIENIFGHLASIMDGVNIIDNPTSANGGNDTTVIFTATATEAYSDDSNAGYAAVGTGMRAAGYVRQLIFGDGGEILPSLGGGGTAVYWADYHYTSISGLTSAQLRACSVGGHARSGAQGGLAYIIAGTPPSSSSKTNGSRLCFIPTNK